MELFTGLWLGLQTAVTPINLLYCFIGVFVGTLIGVLPGIGPTATIAMLLPASFVLPPISALIMLAGIYYGAQYGGSTTSILVNLPGEGSSIPTTLDGYQMALQGRAGAALATAAIGSFFAGTVATVVIALFAPPLANVALKFGPAEYFSLMVLGLIASVVLARGSLLKAIGMIVLGLVLGLIGTDVNSGAQRYTFGVPQLMDGIGFVVVAMGMCWLWEVLRRAIPAKGTMLGGALMVAMGLSILNPRQIALPSFSTNPDMPISEDYMHDMTWAIDFALEKGGSITGSVIFVDGGYLIS